MKKSQLRRIIREEIQRLNEGSDPTVQQMMSYLKKQFGGYGETGPDEADMIEAMYWFAVDNHSGQGSNLDKATAEIKRKYRYRPSPLANGVEDTDDAVQMVYDELEAEFG